MTVPGVQTDRSQRDAALRIFLLVALGLAIPAASAHWVMGRFQLHMAINSWHTAWGDAAFPWITELANGWVPVVLALVMLRHSWRAFLMMALGTGLAAITVQLLKHLVFDGFDRPSMYLEYMPDLALVAGFDLHIHNSFPSGHSTAAFSMCLALAVIIGKRGPALLLALGASLLALSRVYLSQHFTEDIVAGAALGSMVATAVYFLLYRGPWRHSAALDRKPLGAGR